MTNDQIKEIALHAGFKLKEQPDGSMDLNPYVYTFARHLLAERAVSPAESVQSIRHDKAFIELMVKYIDARQDKSHGTDVTREFDNIAYYIDAKIAAAREEGIKQERKEDDECCRHQAQQIIELRQRAEEAHAEGRRSALEELAKEKERADEAERALKVVQEKNAELARQCDGVLALEIELAALRAARQAPDWTDKQIMALWAQCNMPSEENDFITGPLPFARALLAQPLQQEGGKDSMPVEQEPKYGIRNGFLFNRASGEYIPSDEPVFIFRARDWHAVNILAGYAHEVKDEDHAAAVWKRVDDFKRFWNAHPERMKQPDTAPQPSDNLQQASTARVGAAKMECPDCGVDRLKQTCPAVDMAKCPMIGQAASTAQEEAAKPKCHKDVGVCGAGGYCQECQNKEAASTAQVEPAKHCKFCGGMGCEACSYQEAASAIDAADMEKLLQDLANWRGSALVGGKLMHFVSQATPEIKRIKEFGAVGDGVTDDTAALRAARDSFSTQATPEDADLPPLPKPMYGYDSSATIRHNITHELPPCFTADQMREYARAARAASQQAAEPVAKPSLSKYATLEEYQEAMCKWHEAPIGEIVGVGDDQATIGLYDTGLVKNGDLVYRAAPPQQADTGGLPG